MNKRTFSFTTKNINIRNFDKKKKVEFLKKKQCTKLKFNLIFNIKCERCVN